LKYFHAKSVGNCRFENVKFGPKTGIGRIFLSPYCIYRPVRYVYKTKGKKPLTQEPSPLCNKLNKPPTSLPKPPPPEPLKTHYQVTPLPYPQDPTQPLIHPPLRRLQTGTTCCTKKAKSPVAPSKPLTTLHTVRTGVIKPHAKTSQIPLFG